MNVKIDTKEKFQEITVLEPNLTANMTDDLADLFKGVLEKDVANVVLNLEPVAEMDPSFARSLAALQNKFYESNYSFVICGVQKPLEQMLESEELIESMNITPSLSEAWDMVQMEEIERDLLDEFES
jgi:anti-anti-sigma regulatory factor